MPDFKCLNQKGQSLFRQEESMRLWLHSEFESSLSYMIPCLLKKGIRKRKKKKNYLETEGMARQLGGHVLCGSITMRFGNSVIVSRM